MNKNNKLFRITVKGLSKHKTSYIVAKDPTSAYEKLRKYLDARDYGFGSDREMEKIELIAEEYDYSTCETWLLT